MKGLQTVLSLLILVSNGFAQGEYESNKAGDLEAKIPRNQRHAEFHNWGFEISNSGWNLTDRFATGNILPGGEFPKNTSNFLVHQMVLTVGVLKDSTAGQASYRYSVSSAAAEPVDFGAGPITNSNVPFDSLVWDSIGATDNVVYLIDTARAGSDWITWPWQDGAPWDSINSQPILFSQEDSWTVYNDADTSLHIGTQFPNESPIPGIGIEVQQSSYEFGVTANAVLFRWKIINKTNVSYDSAFAGIYLDPDIGIPDNDQNGTDTLRKMAYAYNHIDESTPTNRQYAVGTKILHFQIGANPGSFQWFTDGHTRRSPCSVTDVSQYFLSSGRDCDGSQRLALEGLVESDGSPFTFPGDPVTNTGLVSQSVFPTGGETDFTLTVGPFQLQPGVVNDLIVAVIAGEGEDRNGAIIDLRQEADNLQNIYDNYLDFFLRTDSVINGTGPVAAFSPTYRASSPAPFTVQFSDFSIANPASPITSWKWDFQNDGTYESFEQNPTWTYPVTSENYSVKLVVTNAEGSDSLIQDDLIEVYGYVNIPFEDQFPEVTGPDPTKWINTTTHVSDRAKNEPSPPYSLALDSHPVVTSETITSYPFDLTNQSNPGIVLTYAYEGKGNGNAPEPEDSLFVEFHNSLGQWIKARSYPGESMDSFAVDMVALNEVNAGDSATFYFEGFQFRFRNITDDPAGAQHKDVWFIDDVDFDIVDAIGDRSTDAIPRAFKLHQNYPNPFNPTTTIKYDLPRDSKVTIKIYNVLGQEVRTLVDERQTAGYRSVVWNGKNNTGNPVASGVYVYRIEAGEFVRSRKMMLLR